MSGEGVQKFDVGGVFGLVAGIGGGGLGRFGFVGECWWAGADGEDDGAVVSDGVVVSVGCLFGLPSVAGFESVVGGTSWSGVVLVGSSAVGPFDVVIDVAPVGW